MFCPHPPPLILAPPFINISKSLKPPPFILTPPVYYEPESSISLPAFLFSVRPRRLSLKPSSGLFCRQNEKQTHCEQLDNIQGIYLLILQLLYTCIVCVLLTFSSSNNKTFFATDRRTNPRIQTIFWTSCLEYSFPVLKFAQVSSSFFEI